MSRGAHRYIASEGWIFIIATAVSGVVADFYFGLLAALPLWFLSLLLIYLFRDPARQVPPAPLGVVSPADGEVVHVDSVHDNYLQREAIRVSVRMSRLGSYVTRSPIEGKIVQHWHPAQSTDDSAGSREPACYAMQIQTDENDNVVLVMTVACRALKPICYHASGQRIGQGERCGLIRFGGDLELLLPANSRVQVASGDSVVAGSDIVASLIRENVQANAAEEGEKKHDTEERVT